MKLVHQSNRDTPCSVTLESKSFCMADGKRRVPATLTWHRNECVLIADQVLIAGHRRYHDES